MKKFMIYLDMDGVLADFATVYHLQYQSLEYDRKRFYSAVTDFRIFEKLEFLPDTQELLDHIRGLGDSVHVEILTSCGTHNPFVAKEAARQKTAWLKAMGINYKPNFVHNKKEKSQYATPNSILIDDSIGCIEPFNEAGGIGILHHNAKETIMSLSNILLQEKAKGCANTF